MLAHVPHLVGRHDFHTPLQPVSTHEESKDAIAWGQFRARRSHAFAIGETKARLREISADAYLFLYKELVGLAGDRTYCWAGLEFLGERLGTSEGTLKRWMKELEKADLIQRKPRPGGQTSLTYISVFLESDSEVEPSSTQGHCDDDLDEAQHAFDDALANTLPAHTEPVVPSLVSSVQPSDLPVFFGSEQEITIDCCAGSIVIPHTVKIQEIKDRNGLGGGVNQPAPSETDVDEKVIMLLNSEDVQDPDAISELRNKPVGELQALSQYLDKQTNVRCRPGLFVWLAHQGFGAKLLAGRQRHNARRSHHQEVAVPEVLVADARRAELVDLWQHILEQLRGEMPPNEFATWLQPTQLLELEANDAVVATPNIFVRQHIEACFRDRLSEALRVAVDRPVQLHVVIEPTFCST